MRKILKSIFEIALVMVVTSLVLTYLVKPVQVDGSSMKPTVIDKDLALVDVLGYKMNGLKRFDVVIVSSDTLSELLIKRVIGLPGEKVEYKHDKLYINGAFYEEPFLDSDFMHVSMNEMNTERFTGDFSIQLQKGEYFLMGDNRLHSQDSRALGPFRAEDILGKNGFVIYPFDHFGWFNNND